MDTISGIGGEAEARGLVLVVEDDVQVRAVLSRFMALKGHEVLEAADGREAIALARGRAPDIVLLDIAMPGKNGLEVLKELAPVMPGTGFVMVTANDDEELALFCLELGAFDYLPKPVDLEELSRAVAARLQARRPAVF